MIPDPRWPRHALLRDLVLPHLPAGELAHDALHLQRVYRWAIRLAPEAGADPDLCGAAALVHDLVFVPKKSPERSTGGERSAAAAPAVLAQVGYGSQDIAIIAEVVRTSSWSRGLDPTNAVGVILQDADRLDALGAVGLMRTVACGQHMSQVARPGRFYDPQDPVAGTSRPLDDRTQVVDHLPAKLLRLAKGMHTPTARVEAARRHDWLLDFIGELSRELSPTSA